MDARKLSGPVKAAILGLASIGSAASAQPDPFEGHWENPKHSMVVKVSHCASDEYCAIVVKASPKALANARKGGTEHFIGTEILRVRPAGERTFKGTAFDPESNMHVTATVRMVAPGLMDLKGCAIFGLVCEQQRWTKLN